MKSINIKSPAKRRKSREDTEYKEWTKTNSWALLALKDTYRLINTHERAQESLCFYCIVTFIQLKCSTEDEGKVNVLIMHDTIASGQDFPDKLAKNKESHLIKAKTWNTSTFLTIHMHLWNHDDFKWVDELIN